MPEITKTKDQNSKTKLIWLACLLVIVAVYLTGLGIPLLGPDEPRYAEVAREMFVRGDWVTPTLGGFDWFEKPALLYWIEIVSYRLFGVTEFAARFGSALFGLGTVLCLWILGKALSSSRFQVPSSKAQGSNYGLDVSGEALIEAQSSKLEDRNPKSEIRNPKSAFADWLALVAASSFGLIVFSRGASFDIILTFPITAALVAFFLFDLTPGRKGARAQGFLLLFYFFIGIALIAKGLVGIIFPVAIVVFYYLLARRFPPKAFIFSLFWGTLAALAVAALWYLPMYERNGWKFIDEFFIQHHFQRFTSNKYQHPQPFYFFLWVLPLMTLPWLPFFLAALGKLAKEIFSRKGAKTQSQQSAVSSQQSVVSDQRSRLSTLDSRLTTFALAWMLVPLVFFSLSGSKLPGYILPALPGALILTAQYVRQFAEKSAKRRALLQTLGLLVLIGAAITAQFLTGRLLHEETVKHLVETANAQGYTEEKIINLHTISHSLEFYGAGRLVRDAEGKQRRCYGVSEVTDEMKLAKASQALVVIPLGYLSYLTKSELVESQVLDDNGELAIVLVKIR